MMEEVELIFLRMPLTQGYHSKMRIAEPTKLELPPPP